jgi:hypothetical protein
MKIHRLVENAPRQIIAESVSDAPGNAVCVSVGDSIENFEENTLRYIIERGIQAQFR